MPFSLELEQIIETEKELGLLFPKSFKNKMMKENGGETRFQSIEWSFIPFFDRSSKKRLSSTCNHIIREICEAKKWNDFPKKGVAIACDGYGNFLILLPKLFRKKILQKTIFEWNHENGKVNKIAEDINQIYILEKS